MGRQVHRAFLLDCAPDWVVRATPIQAERYAKGVRGVGAVIEAMPLLSPPGVRLGAARGVLTHDIAPVLPLGEVHGATAVLLLALIALHVAGVLYHVLVKRDRVVHRMLPG